MKDYYSILQIKPEATKEEIKAAYRRLAKKYHPDVNGGAPWAEERFKELQEAYSVLSDYFEKEAYDKKYAGSAQKTATSENTARSQTAAPNRPTQQASGSNPHDAAQTKKNFGNYVKNDPRKAQAFSHWMNFDRTSKNSIFDGIPSGKKLRFEFANKVATWVNLLEVFGITALIVIFPMEGQRQLEHALGTKFTFNSPASSEEFAPRIDDAPGVTPTETHPKPSYRQAETPERSKEYSPSHNPEPSSPSVSSERPHTYTSSTSSTISSPHSAFSDQPSPSGSSYSDSKSIVSSTLFETHTEPAPQANAPHQSPPVAERITDYDCECAEGSEAKDFWITEEDDKTHNSSCSRYGKGEGMYSAQGSGTDCPDCSGAHTVSPKTEEPAAPVSRQAPDKVVYWVSLNDGLLHNPSCSQYCSGRGYYTTTLTAKNCPQCGGAK